MNVFIRTNDELELHLLGFQLETIVSFGQWLIGVIL
jgi:hypothetical protein